MHGSNPESGLPPPISSSQPTGSIALRPWVYLGSRQPTGFLGAFIGAFRTPVFNMNAVFQNRADGERSTSPTRIVLSFSMAALSSRQNTNASRLSAPTAPSGSRRSRSHGRLVKRVNEVAKKTLPPRRNTHGIWAPTFSGSSRSSCPAWSVIARFVRTSVPRVMMDSRLAREVLRKRLLPANTPKEQPYASDHSNRQSKCGSYR